MSSFCSAKATHIFLAKNIKILYIESAKTVNEMTLNDALNNWALFCIYIKPVVAFYIDKNFSFFIHDTRFPGPLGLLSSFQFKI